VLLSIFILMVYLTYEKADYIFKKLHSVINKIEIEIKQHL
jgi:hypothetical protein